MADRDSWRTNDKFWCKYCKMFVTDNKISKQQHESNPAHKRNMDRFVALLARQEKEKRKEEADAHRALREIEKAAQESYQRDLVAAGMDPADAAVKAAMAHGLSATPSSWSASSNTKKAPPVAAATKPKPPTEAADDTKDVSAANEDNEPDTTVGAPGDWQVVEETVIEDAPVEDDDDDDAAPKSRKRSLPEDADDVQTAEDPLRAERELHADAPDAGKFRIQERVVSLDAGGPVNTVLGGSAAVSATTMKRRKVVNRNVRKG